MLDATISLQVKTFLLILEIQETLQEKQTDLMQLISPAIQSFV